MEKPTRNASAVTVRLLLPLSRIRKNNADPRLPRMSTKATATMIFMMGFEDKKNDEATLKRMTL